VVSNYPNLDIYVFSAVLFLCFGDIGGECAVRYMDIDLSNIFWNKIVSPTQVYSQIHASIVFTYIKTVYE
jgi:hypothetical protein